MVLKSVGVLSCAKLMGAMYAIMGLIFGAFMTLASLAGVAASKQGGDAGALAIGAGAIVIFPILYGIGGFVGGLISAFVYNVVAGLVGGIEFDFVSRT